MRKKKRREKRAYWVSFTDMGTHENMGACICTARSREEAAGELKARGLIPDPPSGQDVGIFMVGLPEKLMDKLVCPRKYWWKTRTAQEWESCGAFEKMRLCRVKDFLHEAGLRNDPERN